MVINKFKGFVGLGLTAVVLVGGGCDKLGFGAPRPPEEAVRERAQAWADALMAEDFEKAWKYTSPNYREFATAKDYIPVVQGSARWTSAKVDSVACTEDVCDVGIEIEYRINRLNMQNRRSLPYKWVLIDKQWWLSVPAK